MNEDDIFQWLCEEDPERLTQLFRWADATRQKNVGDAVHLRGLIEISNICRRNCLYCGVRNGRANIRRYRLTAEEIMQGAQLASKFGYGTLVLQAGEDFGLSGTFVADIVREIKKRFSLAVTLSLGERPEADWRLWREAGADRYLIRFETGNRALFEAIHPRAGQNDTSDFERRINALRVLRSLDYEVGSGVMIGIPGQTYRDLAHDLVLFKELDLDMVGTGPFLAHPETPLGRAAEVLARAPEASPEERRKLAAEVGFDYPISDEQVPNTNLMGFKVIALTRLLLPDTNIPSTTAIATNDPAGGRITGLRSGANVVMPNLTLAQYRALYEIYPHKAAMSESPLKTHKMAIAQIREAGRVPGIGPGGRLRKKND
jgi:biotin synthase